MEPTTNTGKSVVDALPCGREKEDMMIKTTGELHKFPFERVFRHRGMSSIQQVQSKKVWEKLFRAPTKRGGGM